MDKVYINRFRDNESNDEYFIITKKDCSGLIQAIEDNYYDIESYDSKDEFLEELINNEENADFINYISEKFNFDDFTEVKTRKNDYAGGGIAAINMKKLQQMKFAAECFVKYRRWNGDMMLAAASVNGKYEVEEWIPIR